MNFIIVSLFFKDKQPKIKYILIIEERERGSYGIGCYEKCGDCRDVNQCSNINGTCLTCWCHAGFEGELCKISK